MKRHIIILSFIPIGTFKLQAQHIPVAHSDDGPSICYGYALGRAYGKTWTSTPDCNAAHIRTNQIENKQNPTYFIWNSPYNESEIVSAFNAGKKIIIEFQDGAHVSYVTGVSGGIVVAQVNNNGGAEQTNLSIDQVINGDVEEGVTPRGYPTGFWIKKDGWPNEVKNEFDGGTVKVKGTVYSSPYSYNANWNSSHSIEASMDGQLFQNYVRLFREWKKGGQQIATTKTTTINRTDNGINTEYQYVAYFDKQFDITFQNNFIGVGNPGVIKVNGNQYSSPTSIFHVRQGDSITGLAVQQNYNGIIYSFDHWSDGSTTAEKTFTPSDHSTFTAYYTGKPVHVTITSYSGPAGTPVRIEWQEHPNENVSQYQVWRKYKEGETGQWFGPTLLTTLNRGTTSYTDTEFNFTEGYTDDLLQYDIRAYYNTEGSYADPNWITVFGEGPLYKVGTEVAQESVYPKEYAISNYPNPFNPETKIAFQLVEDAQVELTVYNLKGQRVVKMFKKGLTRGSYIYTWGGKDAHDNSLASGIYLARLVINPVSGGKIHVLTHRMLLIK